MATILNLQTVGDIYLCSCDGDPSAGAGTTLPNGDSVPTGSMGYATVSGVGEAFMKYGAGATQWKKFDMSDFDWNLTGNALTGTATAPNEWFGSNNDFDVVMKRNSVELMRMLIDTADSTEALGFGGTSSSGGYAGFLKFYLNSKKDVFGANVHGPTGADGRWNVRLNRLQTTAATLTTAFTYPVVTGNGLRIKAEVLARADGGSGTAGQIATYERVWSVRDIGGVISIRQESSQQTYEDDKDWDVTGVLSGTDFLVQVKGETGRTIDWLAKSEVLWLVTSP